MKDTTEFVWFIYCIMCCIDYTRHKKVRTSELNFKRVLELQQNQLGIILVFLIFHFTLQTETHYPIMAYCLYFMTGHILFILDVD